MVANEAAAEGTRTPFKTGEPANPGAGNGNPFCLLWPCPVSIVTAFCVASVPRRHLRRADCRSPTKIISVRLQLQQHLKMKETERQRDAAEQLTCVNLFACGASTHRMGQTTTAADSNNNTTHSGWPETAQSQEGLACLLANDSNWQIPLSGTTTSESFARPR